MNQYIDKITSIHGDRYDLSDIPDDASRKSRIMIGCKKHGSVSVVIASLLVGSGCKQCGYEIVAAARSKPKSYFIDRSNEVHNFKYDYSLLPATIKSNNTEKYTIICPEHGEFLQSMQHHSRGHGCMQCRKLGGNYTKSNILKMSDEERKDSWLYITRFYSNDELFIKVGITKHTVEERYAHDNCKDYYFETLHAHNIDLLDAYEIEQATLREFKTGKYRPKLKFSGHTECISIDLLDEIQSFVNSRIEERI